MKNISFCIAHKILALLLVVATLFQASYADESVSIDLDAEYINEFYVIQNQHPPHPDTPLMEQAYRPESLTLESDRDATDVILRRSDTLLTHVERLPGAPEMKELRRRLDQLRPRVEKTDIKNVEARLDLFKEIATIRREITLSNPLLDFSKILFVKSRLSHARHSCDQYFGKNYSGGGSVYVLSDPFGDKPQLQDLLTDSIVQNGRLEGQKLDGGSFLSPELSFDGKNILFAYTECKSRDWSPTGCFHVFHVDVDGANLRQLTDGSWNEFHPCWLPNGRIAFISERRGGFGRCHPRPVPTYTLFSMNRDGGDIVPLSYHETNEWHPSVNNDGMIVYTRWDYIDRGDCIAHHPWITYPDGRDPRAIHGNYPTGRRDRPDMEMNVCAIPGSHLYVATATGHHRPAFGSLVIVDPRIEDDGAMAPVKRLTPYVGFPETAGGRHIYGTTWPLSEDFFLCVCAPRQDAPPIINAENQPQRNGKVTYGIYILDSFGNRELIYRDPEIHAVDPIPLRPRQCPPIIPHATDVGRPETTGPEPAEIPENGTGTVLCMNVYDSTKPWPEGTKIKSLRVIQVYPKATYRVNEPDMGIGSESLARGVLGEVPVEEDGSVRFKVPAGKPIYFQAIDENGLAIQSMQSATYVHPGEKLTCQGCHEPKHRAIGRPNHLPAAMNITANDLTPGPSGSQPLTFPRLVQPVLDRKCVDCHAKEKTAPNLSSNMTTWNRPGYGGGNRSWSESYVALTTGNYDEGNPLKGFAFAFSARPPDRTPTKTSPGQFGARTSKLYELLAKGHYDVKLTPDELKRITLWLDCNSNFYGAHHDLEKQAEGEVVQPSIE